MLPEIIINMRRPRAACLPLGESYVTAAGLWLSSIAEGTGSEEVNLSSVTKCVVTKCGSWNQTQAAASGDRPWRFCRAGCVAALLYLLTSGTFHYKHVRQLSYCHFADEETGLGVAIAGVHSDIDASRSRSLAWGGWDAPGSASLLQRARRCATLARGPVALLPLSQRSVSRASI